MSGPERLRVPAQDGGVLAVPDLDRADELLERSRRIFRTAGPLLELRTQARAEARSAAQDYLRAAGEPVPEPAGDTILMGGHQPELFHPGVWLKNFALNGLARRLDADPLNLIVDTDAAKSVSLTVPAVRLPLPPVREFRPHAERIPLDHVSPGLPYEEWTVRDEEVFRASLASREREPSESAERGAQSAESKAISSSALQAPRTALSGGVSPSLAGSMLPSYWAEVGRQAARTANLPERLVAARRTFERNWGCHNLEVPVSALCRTEAFARFTADLLRELPRFHALFNEVVHAYRQEHDLRSRHHPFPDLARDGEWFEAPFWVWRSGSSTRQRLFARLDRGRYLLRLGPEAGPILSASDLVGGLQALEPGGLKLRPRALTTTLFARLLLADLFLHGIGGGKYDTVTDTLIARFYRMDPPPFLIVSGTLRLPLPVYPSTTDDIRRLERLLRDLTFNPQRHLDANERTSALLAERRARVERDPPDRAGRRERFRALRRLNDELGVLLTDRRSAVQEELQRVRAEVKANAVLRRRDWPFCIYPEDRLRDFCTQVLN